MGVTATHEFSIRWLSTRALYFVAVPSTHKTVTPVSHLEDMPAIGPGPSGPIYPRTSHPAATALTAAGFLCVRLRATPLPPGQRALVVFSRATRCAKLPAGYSGQRATRQRACLAFPALTPIGILFPKVRRNDQLPADQLKHGALILCAMRLNQIREFIGRRVV